MATMNVSLPDEMKAWVEAQVRSGRFGNASDYVRDVIRADRDRAETLDRLRHLVQEGLESGISEEDGRDILEQFQRRCVSAEA